MKRYAEAAPIAINFTVDVDQGITVKPKSLKIQQGEHNARYFQVSLVHDDMPVNLANSEVHFLTQPHGSDEIPTITNCEIYDAENGQIMVAVKDYMSNKSGIISGEFVRVGKDGSSLPFKHFAISVDGSIFVNDGLGQSEPLHSLVSALSRVQRVEEYLEQEFMDVEAKYAGELSKTNAQIAIIKEHCTGGNGMQQHSHVNKIILDGLEENEGALYYKGKEIGKKTIDDNAVSNEYSWSSKKINDVFFSKIRTANLYNKDNAILNKFIDSAGNVVRYDGYSYNEEYIDVSSIQYMSCSNSCIVAQYDENKSFLKQEVWSGGSIESATKYIKICVSQSSMSSFMLVKGRILPSEYVPYYKNVLNENIEVNANNIKDKEPLFEDLLITQKNIDSKMLPKYFNCNIAGTFGFINFDILEIINQSNSNVKVNVSYKIKLNSIKDGESSANLNYRLMNHNNKGFQDTGALNTEIGQMTLGLGVANEVNYEYTLTKANRYLKVVNWVQRTCDYDVWDLKVVINDNVSIDSFEQGVYSGSGTINDISGETYTLATVEYLNKVGVGGGSSANNYKGKKAVFLGDSITHNGSYQSNIKNILELSSISNIAYNGWTSADLVNNKEKIPADTDLISVWIGINDFNTSRPLGRNSDRSNNTFYGSLHMLCSYLAQNFVGKKIAFYTPLHCNLNAFTSPDSLNNQNLKVEDYRKVIHEVCSYYSIPVCDLHAICGIAPHIESHKTLYTSDGLHLSVAGYNKITPYMVEFLRKIG